MGDQPRLQMGLPLTLETLQQYCAHLNNNSNVHALLAAASAKILPDPREAGFCKRFPCVSVRVRGVGGKGTEGVSNAQ